MFEQSVVPPAHRSRAAFALALLVETLALALLVVGPLLLGKYPQLLNQSLTWLAPPAPPLQPRPAPEIRPRRLGSGVAVDDAASPERIAIREVAIGPQSAGAAPAIGIGFGAGSESMFAPNDDVPAPAATAATPLTQPATPMIIGGAIEAARCLECARPLYPDLARRAHIEGSVVLAALIAPDGTISSLRAEAGNPLLAGAAMTAVRRWRYAPLLLDGRAIAVETEITVVFRLGP